MYLFIVLLSLLLSLVSAWTLGTFMRLNRVKNNYNSERALEAACQVSKTYVNVGLWTGGIVTILSLLVLAVSSWIIYQDL